METKKQVAHSLFIQGADKQLIALARKETNLEMKKELVHSLSLMGTPAATDYMMEILNK